MHSNAALYNEIMAEGIPERWTNTVNMQNEFENAQAKGWQVNMRWGKSEHLAAIDMESVGAYVMQDVKKGEVLRKGEEGKNLIIARKMEDFPKLTENSKYFISNYAGACSDVIVDNNNTKELFLWLPGNTRNHSLTPNTVSVKKSYGYDIIATKNIKAGAEILADYKKEYGPAPEWYSKWIIENKTTAIFQDLNSFM